MNTRISQHGYVVLVNKDEETVMFLCDETGGGRVYDLPGVPHRVDVEGQYIYINLDAGSKENSYLQIKLESPHEIVLDHFDHADELITEFGCWDFYDDPE